MTIFHSRQRYTEHRRRFVLESSGSVQGQLRGGGPGVRHHPVGPDDDEVGDRQDHPRHPLQGKGQPQLCHRRSY